MDVLVDVIRFVAKILKRFEFSEKTENVLCD